MEQGSDSQQQKKEEEVLPPGFRFHPTDEELISYYLLNKIADQNFTGKAIADVDLNKSEPWELPEKAKMEGKEWYFFSLRDRKYPTGVRTNRATNTGYWKTTGKDKEIFNTKTSELVGMKKTLVFYRGRAPRGEKSSWVMHEYRLHSKSSYRTSKQDEWVVCRVFKKTESTKKYISNNSSSSTSHHHHHNNNNTRTSILSANNINPNHYSSSDLLQLQHHLQPHPSLNINQSLMANAVHLAELSRVFRGSTSSTMDVSAQQQQLMSYNNHMPVSGLNLNLGGALVQPPAGVSLEDVGTSFNGENGFGNVEMSQCMDLDGYWPSY